MHLAHLAGLYPGKVEQLSWRQITMIAAAMATMAIIVFATVAMLSGAFPGPNRAVITNPIDQLYSEQKSSICTRAIGNTKPADIMLIGSGDISTRYVTATEHCFNYTAPWVATEVDLTLWVAVEGRVIGRMNYNVLPGAIPFPASTSWRGLLILQP